MENCGREAAKQAMSRLPQKLILRQRLPRYNHVSVVPAPAGARKSRRVGREAEGGGLLNRYRTKSSIGGSNPPLSAITICKLLRTTASIIKMNKL
jgi:hypothetical protein